MRLGNRPLNPICTPSKNFNSTLFCNHHGCHFCSQVDINLHTLDRCSTNIMVHSIDATEESLELKQNLSD